MFQKANIILNLSNIPGWRTNRKIIVIESDDWGSIRMPSKETFNNLMLQGLDLDGFDSYRYNHYDTLASSDDLAMIYEVLSDYKDKNGRNPVITAVSLVANPDFDKIKKSGFSKYYYEPFTNTLKKYGRENAVQLWKEGKEKSLFVPQFHGREHLNIGIWIRALNNNDKETMLAFGENMWGFNNKHPRGISYQAAFDLEFAEDLKIQEEIIKDGLKLFKTLHGFNAEYFVPPNGPFNNSLEKVAAENGIKYMMGPKIQREALGNGRTRKVLHWLGQKNKYGQRYITRNSYFEPSDKSKDWVDSCLSEIATAFRWHKPAVISSHRVNYIGSLDPANRSHGLQQLNKLLRKVVSNWENVEFMTSTELGELISKP